MAANATSPSAISIADLNTTLNHEPRIKDIRLAERLGFDRPRDIRKLIERSRAELEGYAPICATVAQNTDARGRGRPGTEYWLTEGQTLLVCMFSRTPEAAAVRKEVINVFMAWRAGHFAAPPQQPAQPANALGLDDGRYLLVIRRGKVGEIIDVDGHSVIDGRNVVSLATFLREGVPLANLPVALEIISKRCSVLLRHGPKGAPVPAAFQAKGD